VRPQALFEADADRFAHERRLYRQGYRRVAGVDEVGRGPLAGPVVAACVVLPADLETIPFDDSKKLSAGRRAELVELLREMAVPIGIGIVEEAVIDSINILQASLLAMRKAVEAIDPPPDFLLVDGCHPVPVAIDQQPLVKGDGRSAAIAAASIVAKVTRDRLMEEYHRSYPCYNFHRNKGYPTRDHREALRRHGPCPIHRRSFKGVCDAPPPPDDRLPW